MVHAVIREVCCKRMKHMAANEVCSNERRRQALSAWRPSGIATSKAYAAASSMLPQQQRPPAAPLRCRYRGRRQLASAHSVHAPTAARRLLTLYAPLAGIAGKDGQRPRTGCWRALTAAAYSRRQYSPATVVAISSGPRPRGCTPIGTDRVCQQRPLRQCACR